MLQGGDGGYTETTLIYDSFGIDMKELAKISTGIIGNLSRKEKVREKAIALTREINRGANEVVYDIHHGKPVQAKLGALKKQVQSLNKLLSDYPDMKYGGFTLNALQEYAEASIFHAIIEKKKVPTPDQLEISDVPYALGMGDVVGELRRMILNMLIENELEPAKTHFRTMEQLTEILSKFNFPDGLIPIRRKQDIARGILEKTQGELAVALSTSALAKKIDRV
jgi:translin